MKKERKKERDMIPEYLICNKYLQFTSTYKCLLFSLLLLFFLSFTILRLSFRRKKQKNKKTIKEQQQQHSYLTTYPHLKIFFLPSLIPYFFPFSSIISTSYAYASVPNPRQALHTIEVQFMIVLSTPNCNDIIETTDKEVKAHSSLFSFLFYGQTDKK